MLSVKEYRRLYDKAIEAELCARRVLDKAKENLKQAEDKRRDAFCRFNQLTSGYKCGD